MINLIYGLIKRCILRKILELRLRLIIIQNLRVILSFKGRLGLIGMIIC
jgi:hypothetical protein